MTYLSLSLSLLHAYVRWVRSLSVRNQLSRSKANFCEGSQPRMYQQYSSCKASKIKKKQCLKRASKANRGSAKGNINLKISLISKQFGGIGESHRIRHGKTTGSILTGLFILFPHYQKSLEMGYLTNSSITIPLAGKKNYWPERDN